MIWSEQADKLIEDIQKLIESDVLEIYIKDNSVSIPYMMNDAVECYYTLSNCVIQGQWEKKNARALSCTLEKDDRKLGLIMQLSSGNVFTIWFESFQKHFMILLTKKMPTLQ